MTVFGNKMGMEKIRKTVCLAAPKVSEAWSEIRLRVLLSYLFCEELDSERYSKKREKIHGCDLCKRPVISERIASRQGSVPLSLFCCK